VGTSNGASPSQCGGRDHDRVDQGTPGARTRQARPTPLTPPPHNSLITDSSKGFVRVAKNSSTGFRNTMLTYETRIPDGVTDGAPLVVLLHGRGANERDLMGLLSRPPPEWIVIFPRATFSGTPWG